jgi:quinohemoprotein ethanol dehydrogenase
LMKKEDLTKAVSDLFTATLLFGFLFLGACIRSAHAANSTKPPIQFADVTPERLVNADAEPGTWMTGGRDWRQAYYSPLALINKENVRTLGFAWAYDVPFQAGFQSTPILVDGIMFTSGDYGNVYAIDARTGQLRWSFAPKIDRAVLGIQCCGGVNRGVAVWRGKVYVGAVDGTLYALDAATGSAVWTVDTIYDHAHSYTSTGAPYVANELVVIGNSGAEYDARGYITAYNIQTGKLAWRFFTVPGDPKNGFEQPELKMAARTWGKDTRWEVGLGGTAWDGMAYDPRLDLLYVGTGNGLPWSRKLRSPSGGDHLFVASILAIKARTGRLAWYYQTTPGDNWDYDATQKFILADLKIDGRQRNVLMQAPKNGFFYVLDRATGELLSAKPYVYVNWASHVDPKTGRPVETGKTDYSRKPRLVFPTQQGGHNWNPMSYNPGTGLVYMSVLEEGEIWGNAPSAFKYQKSQWNIGVEIVDPVRGPSGLDAPEATDWPSLKALCAGEPDPQPHTFLRAWDPTSQSVAWELEMTTGDRKPPYGAQYGARHLSGVMSTAAGLVFQGNIDGHLRVYDGGSGELLQMVDVGTSINAAPMTYSLDGEQYVAVMAGANAQDPAFADYNYGNTGRVVAFKLGGGKVPLRPVLERSTESASLPPVYDVAPPEKTSVGRTLFESHCAVCHASGGRAPDLTQMSAKDHAEFLDIVLQGSRLNKGMANFGAVLSQEDAEAIHAYVVHLSWDRYRKALELRARTSSR